ncbi:MAG: hypothetical protein FJ146_09235 [Deltaproteobacteria bacterium]|nr:hypothetical protein [Deltaproteobacteria bacterium]
MDVSPVHVAPLMLRLMIGMLSIGFSACGVVEKVTKKGGSKAAEISDSSTMPLPNDGILIDAIDLAVAPGFVLEPYTQAQLLYELNTSSEFYNVQPEPETKSDFIKCIEDKFKDSAAVANKKSVVIKLESDVSECLRIVLTSPDYVLKSVQGKNRHYYYAVCEGADVSAMNGFKWASGAKSDVKCPKITEMTQTITDSVVEYEVDGVVIKKTQRAMTHAGNKNLGGCTVLETGDIKTLGDDCLKIIKNETITTTSLDTARSLPVRKYKWTKISYKGVTANSSSKDHVWYSSGSVTLDMSGWVGTIKYTDSKIPPTYSMLNAVSGGATDGSLIAMPSEL